MTEPTAPLAADVLAALDLPSDVLGNELDAVHLRLMTACEYLDALRIASKGFAGYVDEVADHAGNPDSLLHYVGIAAFGAHAALSEADQLTVLCCYIDYVGGAEYGGDALTVASFIDWAFDALGMDQPADFTAVPLKARPAAPVAPAPPAKAKRSRKTSDGPLPDQRELPLADPAPAAEAPAANGRPGRRVARPAEAAARGASSAAPAAEPDQEEDEPAAVAPPDWTGKKVKYRAGKTIVVGTVTEGTGPTLAIAAETGAAYPSVPRALCSLVKAAAAPVVAAPPRPPTLTINAPATKVTKYQALFDKADSFVAGKPADSPIYSLSVDFSPEIKVYAEVVNGTPGSASTPARGCYLDVCAMRGSELLFVAPPSRTFVGLYELTIAGEALILEVKAE